MIKKFFLPLTLLFSLLLVLSSCDDEPESLYAHFELSVSGEAPNAEVTITSTTTGASTFLWTFGPGAEIGFSSEENPGPVTVEKVGMFEVTLVAKNGDKTETVTQVIEITGNNPIIVYNDVAFAREAGSATYGRFFSTAAGRSYKHTEVSATTGPLIDLAFAHIGDPVNYFTSPDNEDENFNIPNARTTKIINYTTPFGITTGTFDDATDDGFLKDVVIAASDNDSFGTSHPYIVLFETESGRKGAIKTKAVNADRLLVDIKVQKY